MSSAAPRSGKNHPPPLDPALQSRLVSKFGPKLMKQGFTALPVLVQKYYRYVPGNTLPQEAIDVETGEVFIVGKISYMTPTEYAIMTAIWSFWWTSQSNPWPSVEQVCKQLGRSERTIRRYLQRLRDKGFMLSLEQYSSDGKQISNRYDFTPFLKRLIAYLDALELHEKPVQGTTRDARIGRERMPELAGRGCQNWQGIEDETNPNSSDEENSDSSGEAASSKGTVLAFSTGTYSHIARRTIGSADEDTNGTEETNRIASNRTSNPSVTEKEMAGVDHAKEVKRASDSKKITPFERTAMLAGVPQELVATMQAWLQSCPRPEKHPLFIEGIIATFSLNMDNATFLQSNLTQATKLYRYAELKGFTEDDFRFWLYEAEKRARREGVSNKMAYFFVALKVELLVAIAGSQWPQPPEPDDHVVEETIMRDAAEMANDQEGVETTFEGLLEAQQADPQADLPAPPPSEASAPSEHESEQNPALVIFCDDPTAGWKSYETATWWADRLRDHLGKDQYGYRVWPTEHGKWAFVFFAFQNPAACEALVTGAAVTSCIHHGWQPPIQEQT